MAAKYSLMLFCGGMLLGMAPAARLQTTQLLNHEKAINMSKRACFWGHEHCCCEMPSSPSGKEDVTCKKFITGIIDGKEACKCGDSIVQKKLGISGHQATTWRDKYGYFNLRLNTWSSEYLNPLFDEMDNQCSGSNGAAVEFEGAQPAGSCTDDRLFELAKGSNDGKVKEEKIECLDYLQKSTKRNRDRLETSTLMKTFDDRMTGSSLMGCAKIGLGCQTGSLQSKAIVTAISNVKTTKTGGKILQNLIMDKARQMLEIESGLSPELSKELLDWAFYHEEGKNPYCDPATLGDRRDILVKGLTAEEPGHVVKDLPWKYGDEVFGPIKTLLEGTIDGMFAADCEKPEPWATAEEAQEGKGVKMFMTDEELAEKTAKEQAAAESKNYMVADIIQKEIFRDTAGERLLEFAKLSPMIQTTLEYLEKPVLEHKIEANEAEFVRLCMKTLADLLHNEKFMKHLKRFGEIDNWDMPVELEGLWAKTRKAKYGERIWPDSLVDTLRQNRSKAHPPCDCKDISPSLGLHFLNMLPKIGLDFGSNVHIGANGKLASDKETQTLEHVDLNGFAETMIMVEAGIADPVFAVKYITKVLMAYGEKGGSESGLPDVSASGKVKGVLVGMPIIQNLWSALNEETSPVVFAKKMKWFFVANIAWAVWHAIETPLPPEDVVLGLLTLAYSTLSSFKYEGGALVFSNSKEFTDQMLAVYTVWNYRFVKQWASGGKAEDQWMHVSVALSMPIIEALVNHGDVRHYINYRRDDLFHSMLLMLKNQ